VLHTLFFTYLLFSGADLVGGSALLFPVVQWNLAFADEVSAFFRPHSPRGLQVLMFASYVVVVTGESYPPNSALAVSIRLYGILFPAAGYKSPPHNLRPHKVSLHRTLKKGDSVI